MIVERIASYVQKPEPAAFDELARAAFAFQFERIPVFRALCERQDKRPEQVASWREIPLVPTAAFASVELAAAPSREVFRSSGTLGGERSVHHHPFPDLYRAVIDATFPRYLLPTGDRPPMLALVPPRELVGDSSLGFMVDHVLRRFGGPGSTHAVDAQGVEMGKARSWLGAHQRGGRPVRILATAFALADLLDFLARMNLRFRLPAGSAIFETGGFKGRTRTLERADLLVAAEAWLGVPPSQVVSEYGMTELTSQAYTSVLLGGAPDLFVTPPWLEVRALDPETLAELPEGASGLLAFFDLANVGSALHLLTEDLGSVAPGGFRLAGRAPEAALRGCSLLAEELSAGGQAAP